CGSSEWLSTVVGTAADDVTSAVDCRRGRRRGRQLTPSWVLPRDRVRGLPGQSRRGSGRTDAAWLDSPGPGGRAALLAGPGGSAHGHARRGPAGRAGLPPDRPGRRGGPRADLGLVAWRRARIAGVDRPTVAPVRP